MNLSFGLHYFTFGDIVLDGSLSKIKHSSSIVVDCILDYVLKMLPVLDHLSPLSNTPGCVAVVKSSENVCKNPLALSLQLGMNF